MEEISPIKVSHAKAVELPNTLHLKQDLQATLIKMLQLRVRFSLFPLPAAYTTTRSRSPARQTVTRGECLVYGIFDVYVLKHKFRHISVGSD
jgi:hypothetical protein